MPLIIGYVESADDATPADGSGMALTVLIVFVAIVVGVLALFALLIRAIRAGLRNSVSSSNRRRRAVTLMLATRVLVPLVTGFLPTIVLTASLHFESASV